jgi:hypothetical protein
VSDVGRSAYAMASQLYDAISEIINLIRYGLWRRVDMRRHFLCQSCEITDKSDKKPYK